MKLPKTPMHLTWFEHHNRRHFTFMIAVALMALLFIASIIGILSGRYKPFADILNPGSARKLNHVVTMPAGNLDYLASDGSTITTNSANQTVTIKAITKAGIELQGANLERLTQINSKVTVYLDGQSVDNAVVRALETGTSGKYDDDRLKMIIDSDDFRTPIDNQALGAKYTVVVKPDYHLAKKLTGVTNMRDLGQFDPAEAGDLDNDNDVDISDFAILGPLRDQPVDPNSKFDLNNDSQVNIQDFAIMGPNYGKSGERYKVEI